MDVYESLNRWNDAHPLLVELERLEKNLTLLHRARLRNYLAIERPAEAEVLLLEGAHLADAAGDVLLGGKARMNLVGRVYGPTGRMEEAIGLLKEILSSPDVAGMALLKGVALMNLGTASWFSGDLLAGERYLRQSARLFRKMGLPHRESAVANNLAGLFGEFSDFLKVARWSKRAIRLAEAFSQRSHLALARLNLVTSLLALGKTREAKGHIEHSILQARAQGQRTDLAHALQRKAHLAFLQCDGRTLAVASKEAISLFLQTSRHRDGVHCVVPYARYCRILRRPEPWLAYRTSLPLEVHSFLANPPEPLGRVFSALDTWACSPPTTQKGVRMEPERDFSLHSVDALLVEAEADLEGCERGRSEHENVRLLSLLDKRSHCECQLAAFLIRRVASGTWPGNLHVLRDMLRRTSGGVHGLRLLALLLQSEGFVDRSFWEGLL